ncbi:MAG: PIN domain nuclease [Terriglobales bacterium]
MILVDSSVWVDFFRRSPGRGGVELRRMIEESEPFALTGIIVAEVLQSLTRDAGVIERFLAQWDMLEPSGFDTYRSAAAIYRAGRGKGITSSTIDTLVAAIALEHGASVFTLDQDFVRIAHMTGLELYSGL